MAILKEDTGIPLCVQVAADLRTKMAAGDLGLACHLAEGLVERAAKLTAVNLASIALKSGAGRDPRRPIRVTADGTTFYQLRGLRERALRFLEPFLLERHGVRCAFARVDNAPLIGAAIAALTTAWPS